MQRTYIPRVLFWGCEISVEERESSRLGVYSNNCYARYFVSIELGHEKSPCMQRTLYTYPVCFFVVVRYQVKERERQVDPSITCAIIEVSSAWGQAGEPRPPGCPLTR